MAEPGNTQEAMAMLNDAEPRDRRCETPGVLNEVRKYPTTVGGKAFGVNVYAVIVDRKPATRSRSGEFYCSFKIMDPSLLDVEEFPLGLDARVFSSDVRKIPPTQNDGGSGSNWIDQSLKGREIQLGDILRLHRAWFEKNTVVAQLEKGGSLCLFTSNSNDLVQPYWSSHPNVDRRAEGDSKISRLRQFSEVAMERVNTRRAQGILGTPFDRRFDELTNRMFCDLFVKVLQIDKKADGSKLLWIWDGTDVKPQKFKADNPNTVDADSQASEFRQLGDESVHRPLVPELSALSDFPEFGTIMPLSFSDKVEQLDPAPYDNTWVKLRNVIVHSIDGQLQAFFHSKSCISALHDAGKQSRTRNSMERMNLTSAWPSTHFCTGSPPVSQTVRKHLPVVPLRKVLQETFRRGRMNHVITSYRCKVRVLASDPVGDFCRQGSSRSEWVFGVLLHLEDATGDLVAALYGQRAEAFFGMQAFDVSDAANSYARLKLEYAHSKLMDPSCWLECCLQVIWENLSEKPTFFIADTKMNLDYFQDDGNDGDDDGGLGETGQNAARDGVGRESLRKRRNTSAGEDAERERARKRRNTTSGVCMDRDGGGGADAGTSVSHERVANIGQPETE